MNQTEKALHKQPQIWAEIARSELPHGVKKLLRNAKKTKVYWIGLGSSFHAALWADSTLKLRSRTAQSEAITTWDAIKFKLAARQSNALFVLISHRGLSGLTLKLWTELAGSKKLLISADNPNGNPAPHLVSCEQEISNAHTKSLFGAIAQLDCVIQTLAGVKSKNVSKTWIALTQFCSEAKDLPKIEPGTWFVGAGPYFAVARELALKAQEMLYEPAHAYDLEMFLHGPFAALDSRSKVIPFGTKFAGLRGSGLKKAIGILGCTKALENFEQSLKKAKIPKLPPEYDALSILILGQWACLREAARTGSNADSNRKHVEKYRRAFQMIS